jgi:hypothetical protein
MSEELVKILLVEDDRDRFVKAKIDVERLEHALETAVQDGRSKRRSSTLFAPPEISTASTSPAPAA